MIKVSQVMNETDFRRNCGKAIQNFVAECEIE